MLTDFVDAGRRNTQQGRVEDLRRTTHSLRCWWESVTHTAYIVCYAGKESKLGLLSSLSDCAENHLQTVCKDKCDPE